MCQFEIKMFANQSIKFTCTLSESEQIDEDWETNFLGAGFGGVWGGAGGGVFGDIYERDFVEIILGETELCDSESEHRASTVRSQTRRTNRSNPVNIDTAWSWRAPATSIPFIFY